MKEIKVSRSRSLGAKVVYEALKVLSEGGGEMRGQEVISSVEKRVAFDSWESEQYEKTGYIRWKSFLHFFSIDCIKAGFLVKKKGVWFITPEGEQTLKLGPIGLLDEATRKYREWKKQADLAKPSFTQEVTEEVDEEDDRQREMALDEIEALALDGITKAINSKTPYEFQDLAAALLRSMGYFTPFVAPRGKDGGVDIMAYRDPLGTQSPRIKVQIKHRESTTPVPDVRQLMGLLQKDGDVGIFFSTGGFTPDAKSTARSSHVHVELIDLERFIDLWRQFYDKLSDEDKAMLPLTPVYFIAPANI
ncbi:MAG: restriction endonuclease [Chloracidobacterium sp.]|nr:restriction endonuclease [Chloracidobacterium sp.]